MLQPYSESIFDLRSRYGKVFPSLFKFDQKEALKTKNQMLQDQSKIFKIAYEVNILPSMDEDTEAGRIMDALAKSNELELFKSQLVRDVISFKWDMFAGRIHKFGAFLHAAYAVCLFCYVKYTFVVMEPIVAEGMIPKHAMKENHQDYKRYIDQFHIEDNKDFVDQNIYPPASPALMIAQAVLLMYPLFYELGQLCKGIGAYFASGDNVVDMFHVTMGFLTVYTQWQLGTWSIVSRTVLILTIWVTMLKTFSMMRVILSYSYIVTMLREVTYDLRVFMSFFVILIFCLSMIFDIIAQNHSDEYLKISPYVGNLISTLRLSLGDFDFSLLDDQEQVLVRLTFWVVWLVSVLYSSLIFLNFIIAEVSNSYAKVRE